MSETSLSPPTIAGYAHGPTTKPPNWHALVALDVLFNNLASGLFLVAALAELVAPRIFAMAATTAYVFALLFLVLRREVLACTIRVQRADLQVARVAHARARARAVR